MRYISTRGGCAPQTFTQILLEGLAAGGGLFVPDEYPLYTKDALARARTLSYPELAYSVLSKFVDDIPPGDLYKLITETYTKEIFGSEEIVPLKKLEEDLFLLDLSEGPTLAFKDVALQLLGRLFEYTLKKENTTLNILGATSGDTGSAAEYAMRGRRGINVFMLSPFGRMSEFQRKQMYTLQDENIFNLAIKGTFDDCQDVVKEINADAAFKKEMHLGAVNSINWARIAAQVVYYFWGYFRATEKPMKKSGFVVAEPLRRPRRMQDTSQSPHSPRLESEAFSSVSQTHNELVSFAVPTGNFGDILAGYVAKRMGLPIRQLILATNENNVLEEFFKTGTYRPRKGSEVRATSSPSMDISKASNFERYIFDIVGRDSKKMNALWASLRTEGEFTIPQTQTGIIAGSSTHVDRLATIRTLYEKYHVVIDPHTADGVTSGLKLRDPSVSLICLETALPAKFAVTIWEALGREPEIPESFRKLESMSERFEVLAPEAGLIKSFMKANC